MLLPVDQALTRIRQGIAPLTSERVTLREARGRVLAAPVTAGRDQPPFDASAMDGYAVRTADVHPDAVLTQIGTSQAGERFAGTLAAGECVRIFTGAPMPTGADAVVMQEDVRVESDRVAFTGETTRGNNVRSRGNDFHAGTTLLPSGTMLTPAAVALAAAANAATCTVTRRPRIGLLATGDELVPPGGDPDDDQIISSNSLALSALFDQNGGSTEDYGIAPDTPDALYAALEGALDSGVDILVTSGGASVGDHDYVQATFRDLGVEIDFWRIAMRPGKPLMFGRRDRTLVFGLPGNPVSAMVTAQVMVLPALRSLLGLVEPSPLRMPLASPLPENGQRRHFIRARYAQAPDGITGVESLQETDSGHLSSMARAQCLIVQPENSPELAAGHPIEVLTL